MAGLYFGGHQCIHAHVVPQETEELCGDCLQLVAAVKLELVTNSGFTQTLVSQFEPACKGLAPDLAQQVRLPASCWARSSMPPWHRHTFCSCLLSSSSHGAGHCWQSGGVPTLVTDVVSPTRSASST